MSDFESILNEPDEVEAETPVTSEPENSAAATTENGARGEVVAAQEPTPETATESEDLARAANSPTLPEGYKLDALNRLHGPDGRVISKDEAAKILGAAPVATPTPQPEAPKVEEVAAAPFKYRAAGQTHDLQHATLDAKGAMVVSPEGVGAIRQALNSHHILPQFQARVAQLEKQVAGRGENETRSKTLVDGLAPILTEPDEAKAIEAFFKLRADFPAQLHKAEVEFWKSRANGGQQESAQPAATTMPAEQDALHVVEAFNEDLKFENEFRGLSDADWKQYGDLVRSNPYAFLRPATAEHAKQYGVRVGEIVHDTDAQLIHLRAFAQRSSQAREAEAAARKAKEAATFNAAQRQTPVQPPTRPTPKPAAVAAGPAKKPWDQAIKDAWSDTDDEE